MGYKVIGKLIHDGETFDHGDSISESEVGGEDNFKELVAAKAVITDEEFKQLYPDSEDGEVVDPSGMPSNLRQVEGTELQANMPKDESDKSSDGQKTSGSQNPADPPEVKGAGDPKAAAKKAESNKGSDNK